jgi:hypothetical protein
MDERKVSGRGKRNTCRFQEQKMVQGARYFIFHSEKKTRQEKKTTNTKHSTKYHSAFKNNHFNKENAMQIQCIQTKEARHTLSWSSYLFSINRKQSGVTTVVRQQFRRSISSTRKKFRLFLIPLPSVCLPILCHCWVLSSIWIFLIG